MFYEFRYYKNQNINKVYKIKDIITNNNLIKGKTSDFEY